MDYNNRTEGGIVVTIVFTQRGLETVDEKLTSSPLTMILSPAAHSFAAVDAKVAQTALSELLTRLS